MSSPEPERRYPRDIPRFIKAILKRLLPKRLLGGLNRLRGTQIRRRYSKLSRREAFTLVYASGAWGSPFWSGPGSDPMLNREYLDYVRHLIASRAVGTVVDLGCGDFRIGAEISKLGVRYEGVDIVPELIARNQRKTGSTIVRFHCLDIVEDELPPGDLCLVRQVFQHLTNSEIERVLQKVESYSACLVTEHIPQRAFTANLDKPHGPDTRLPDGSGVMLDQPPFSRSSQEVVVTSLADGTRLRTVLLVRDSQS